MELQDLTTTRITKVDTRTDSEEWEHINQNDCVTNNTTDKYCQEQNTSIINTIKHLLTQHTTL